VVATSLCLAASSTQASPPAPTPPDLSFPDFDYEVICYAQNIFVQGGGSLADISSCKKEEEDARDITRAVWPKMWPEAKVDCASYAKGFARGSYRRLKECLANGLLLTLREGGIAFLDNNKAAK
jgi:hypothetical protein